MGSWSKCKLASTAALLLLLSLESYATHAAAAATADGGNRILSLVKNAEHIVEQHERILDSKSAKQPEHRQHHGGGGKHDAGPEGHHLTNGGKSNKQPAPAVASSPSPPSASREDDGGSSKSGKATSPTPEIVLAVSVDVATADSDDGHVDDAISVDVHVGESAGEHMAHEIVELEGSGQHHTSKAAKDMKEEEYVMTDDSGSEGGASKSGKEDSSSSSSGGTESKSDKDDYTASGKSGKLASSSSTTMSYPESDHTGKAGKATGSSGGGHGGGGSGAKTGKADATAVIKGSGMSYETKSDKEMDPEAKVTKEPASEDHTNEVKGSVKPKAEKQLTEWFIKEPTHGGSTGGASSGKSGKSAGGSDEDHDVASGKSGKAASSGGDGSGSGYSGKSGKAHMSYDSGDDAGGSTTQSKAGKAVMSLDPSATPVPAPIATMVPAPTPTDDTPGPSPDEPATPAPTEPATPPPAEPTVPAMPTDLMTLSPTLPPMLAPTDPPAPEPDTITDGPDTSMDDPNSKWFPTENDAGVRSCEYGTTELPEAFQFETEEDCCAAFPEACPPDVLKSPPAPSPDKGDDRDGFEDDEPTTYPTYMPTGPPTTYGEGGEFKEPLLSTIDGTNTATLEPFALKYFADAAEPNWDEEIVKNVTMRHLVHSFRNCINLHDASVCTQDWQLDTLNLMILEHERHLMHEPSAAVSNSPAALRYLAQHPVYELIFGGVLHFPEGVPTPTVEEMEHVVKASFSHERLEYYIELLKEEGMDVKRARLVDGHELENGISNAEGESEGFNWAGLLIGMSSAFGGVALLTAGSRYYFKRREAQMTIDNLDLDMEKGGDYAIRLQYTNDEIEAYPGSTVAETATQDQLSVPSLVRGEEEVDFLPTPGGTNSFSSSKNSHKSDIASISPLESPQGLKSVPEEDASTASTRYISVFTVKKDCGGKSLDQVDLRALAIAYLSRMLKKFPNTHLLPYDKISTLPAITNIRNIPDDLEELQQYVGNARLDDRTGKVLFNLRVESDEPVSKMKSGSGSSRGMNKFKAKPHTAAPKVADPPKPKSSDEVGNGVEEDAGDSASPKSPKSPKSPGMMEDVEL